MSESCCDENSEALSALRVRQRRTLVTVLLINVALFSLLVAGTWLSSSSALLSQSLDNLGDAATYSLSLWAVALGTGAKARVALVKGLLISGSAVAVAIQIGWRLAHPTVPMFATMSAFGLANMAGNVLCLWLLTRHREDDVNMSSVYECSRNDIAEGIAVLAAAAGVWVFGSGWPDLLVAASLLVLFSRSAIRVSSRALRELRGIRPTDDATRRPGLA